MPHECTTCGRTFEDGSKQMLSGCPDCGGNKFQFQPAGRAAGGSAADADSTADASADADPTAVAEADVEREMPELAKDVDAASAADVDRQASNDAAAERDPAGSAARTGFSEEFEDAEIADEGGEESRAQSDARSSPATTDEIEEARQKMAAAEEERLSAVDDAQASARGTPQGPPPATPAGEETEEFDLSGAVGPEDGAPAEEQPGADTTTEQPGADTTTESVAESDRDLEALREELNDQFESIKITAPGQYELNLMELYDRKEYIISLQEDGRYVIEMADDHGIDER